MAIVCPARCRAPAWPGPWHRHRWNSRRNRQSPCSPATPPKASQRQDLQTLEAKLDRPTAAVPPSAVARAQIAGRRGFQLQRCAGRKEARLGGLGDLNPTAERSVANRRCARSKGRRNRPQVGWSLNHKGPKAEPDTPLEPAPGCNTMAASTALAPCLPLLTGRAHCSPPIPAQG